MVKIEVDLKHSHPAAMSIYPQLKDEDTTKRGPPPWMQKPIDPVRTNSGQLIVKASLSAKRDRRDDSERSNRDGVGVPHHVSSEKVYRAFLSDQLRFVDRPTKRLKSEK